MRDWRKARGFALTLPEREYLRDCAASCPGGLIVNIGIAFGGSLYCLRAGAPKARLIGIDIKKPAAPLDGDLRCKVILGDSRICHPCIAEPIDLLFIDGDHHYAGVKADIGSWASKVAVGGMIIFHDYAPLPRDLLKNPWIWGVRKAVTEWRQQANNWTFIKPPDSLAAMRRDYV